MKEKEREMEMEMEMEKEKEKEKTTTTSVSPSRLSTTYILGVVSLILVVIFWVLSGFLTKGILEKYPKPFYMCYLTNLSYLLYFIFWVIDDPVMLLIKRQNEAESPSSSASPSTEKNLELGKQEELHPFTKMELAKIAFIFFALYLASNYATNVAFGATSVGSASILAATCGFFTLAFGWLMGVEIMSIMRILAVLISVGGVLILGVHEFMGNENRALGNILALVGAVFYGIYSIFLKRVAIDESRISMPILFAFGGLYTLLFAWPVLILLNYTGIEPFELPPNMTVVWSILVNVILGGFIPNYLWNVAFVCTSPLVVAIGISFNIPLTLLVERYWYGEVIPWSRVFSGILVVAGFIIVNFANIYPNWDLKAEMLLARLGLINADKVESSEVRTAKLRNGLIEGAISTRRSP